jgi:hypothetical protein
VDDNSTYTVFKGSRQEKPLWLGTVKGRKRAIDLMNRMAARLPDDYFVCNTFTQELVTEVRTEVPVPIHGAYPWRIVSREMEILPRAKRFLG